MKKRITRNRTDMRKDAGICIEMTELPVWYCPHRVRIYNDTYREPIRTQRIKHDPLNHLYTNPDMFPCTSASSSGVNHI